MDCFWMYVIYIVEGQKEQVQYDAHQNQGLGYFWEGQWGSQMKEGITGACKSSSHFQKIWHTHSIMLRFGKSGLWIHGHLLYYSLCFLASYIYHYLEKKPRANKLAFFCKQWEIFEGLSQEIWPWRTSTGHHRNLSPRHSSYRMNLNTSWFK